MRLIVPSAPTTPGDVVAHALSDLLQTRIGQPLGIDNRPGGQIQLALLNSAAVIQALPTGRVKALAVSSGQRLARLPQVPTFQEAGLPNVDLRGWVGVVAPSGTDAAIVARLNAEFNTVLAQPMALERLRNGGSEPVGGSARQFADHIATDGDSPRASPAHDADGARSRIMSRTLPLPEQNACPTMGCPMPASRTTTMPIARATHRTLAPTLSALVTMLALAGCGAEVAGGAATVGTLQTTAAKQAQMQQARVVDGMKAAQDAGMARAASAAD